MSKFARELLILPLKLQAIYQFAGFILTSMKLIPSRYRLPIIICLFAFQIIGGSLTHAAATENQKIDSLLSILNTVIENRPHYLAERESLINRLKEERAGLQSLHDIYVKNNSIIGQYESFICDSAKKYLKENINIATKLNNREWLTISRIRLGLVNSMTGDFLQAHSIFNDIDYSSLPDSIKARFAWAQLKYYGNLAISTDEDALKREYIRTKMAWRDSLVGMFNENSDLWRKEVATRYLEKGDYSDALDMFKDLISREVPETHQHAMMDMGLANIYGKIGDKEKLKEHLISAATTDMKLAIKENEALLALAEHLYTEGNVDLAHEYMRTALEDANYYNSRFKNSIIANIYPIVERSYLDQLKSQRRRMMIVVWCMVALSIVLIIVTLFSIIQTRRVSRSRSELAKANRHLEQFSEKLAEANIIREQYVGYFMNQYSKALEKLESFRLEVKRAIKVNKYDEAYVMASRPFKNELEDLYENFDSAFLSLFPDYIEEFNLLLKSEERFHLPKGQLNTTLRIYALIRLGINDLTQIANFLHYSVQTVYNYKSKIKKAIIVSPDEFERRVKLIGKMVDSNNSGEPHELPQ